MATETLNPTQLHLLKMFSFCKTKSALESIKKALMKYYAEQIDKEMDALWASGEMNDAKQEEFKNGHFRTPYKQFCYCSIFVDQHHSSSFNK